MCINSADEDYFGRHYPIPKAVENRIKVAQPVEYRVIDDTTINSEEWQKNLNDRKRRIDQLWVQLMAMSSPTKFDHIQGTIGQVRAALLTTNCPELVWKKELVDNDLLVQKASHKGVLFLHQELAGGRVVMTQINFNFALSEVWQLYLEYVRGKISGTR